MLARLLVLLITLWPMGAAAHDLSARYGAFLGPAVHMLTEIDHLAAAVGVGLLAAQQIYRTRAAALVAFVLVFLVAMAAPRQFAALDQFELVEAFFSATSLLLVGVVIAVGRPAPLWLAAAISMAVGGVHGLANGLAIEGGAPALSLVGGASSAVLLSGAAAALAMTLLSRPTGRIVVRVIGSWIAALGLMLLGLALR